MCLTNYPLLLDFENQVSERIAEGHMGERIFDELHLENSLGSMVVFYNDEFIPQKTDGVITKLLSKAW